MPRKSKNEELTGWLNEYKSFLAEVDFLTYKAQVCVLANGYTDAINKLAEKYPQLHVNIIHQLTQVVL